MTERTPVPKRMRFEVFKRDKFTCQYCGAKAPDVVLECDHIKPVAHGGESSLLNLITSCRGCNAGKGAIPLSDETAVAKHHAMLADLEERRQQIEMMMEWRNGLQAVDDDAVGRLAGLCARGGYEPSEIGRADLRRWMQRFSFGELAVAIDKAFAYYAAHQGEELTVESWAKAFGKIPNIADMERQAAEKPYLPRLLYIQGIIRKRSRVKKYNCVDYLEHLYRCGASLDDMERRAKGIREIPDFEDHYDAWLESIGSPF